MDQPAPSVDTSAGRDSDGLTTNRAQGVNSVYGRQKRKQVARACDECRAYRIKCDSGHPCANCLRKARNCSNGTGERPSTLALAEKKIHELESRVQQLRQELQSERVKARHQKILTPSSSTDSPQDSTTTQDSYDAPKRAFNRGVSLRPPRSTNDSWFGPSSLYYFITRLAQPLSSVTQHSTPLEGLMSTMPSAVETSKLVGHGLPNDASDEAAQLVESMTIGGWNSMQEQYFIDRYWESYNAAYAPILDEAEFKTHHQSLWSASGGPRKPSALVDIVVAICMQFGVPKTNAGPSEMSMGGTDSAVAGRRYYRRCQALLTYEMESPSLATLQCHLLCAIYVCAGSFHNKMDASVALAVRTAYILGLHLDPPEWMSPKEKEKRRRLWWATYLLETKIATKLGRPFSIDDSHLMPQLPSDDMEAATLAGSLFAPIGPKETWLSFNRYHIALYREIREAHIAFFSVCAAVEGDQQIWDDAGTLDRCAKTLLPHRQRLRQWRDSVPSVLTTKRRGNGVSLSTDGTAIELELFAPLWLQRQCLLLELAYHHLSINMLRPLISFSARPEYGGLAEELANECALHAITFTKMVHQVLTTEATLNNWHETFHWQWSATMTLVGFVLANPTYSRPELAKEARHAVDLAAVICDEFAKTFAVAHRAAKIVRELCVKMDSIISQWEAPVQLAGEASIANYTGADELSAPGGALSNLGAPFYDPSSTDVGFATAADQNLFDMVLGVDFWDNMDVWWPDVEMEL